MKDSYILESRKILESDIWKKPPLYFKVWHYLLLKAQHKDYGNLKRGQLFTNINEIREECSYFAGYRKIIPSRQEIHRVLDWLRSSREDDNERTTNGQRKGREGSDINKNDKNDNNNIPPVSPLKTQKAMLDECLCDKVLPLGVKVALEEWIQYKAERNERYKLSGMRSLVTRAINAAKEYGADKVVNVINDSMASGYKGIVWDRCARGNPKSKTMSFNNSPKREYDMTEQERMLIATN